jgi:hypothetical protein
MLFIFKEYYSQKIMTDQNSDSDNEDEDDDYC